VAEETGYVVEVERLLGTHLAAWIPMDRLDELAKERADLVDVGLELARTRPATGHTCCS
jgi:hypothetical protein